MHYVGLLYRERKEEIEHLVSCVIKVRIRYPIFKNEMFFYQFKANLGAKSFHGKITHLLYPNIRKMLTRGVCGNESSTFDFFHYLLFH